MYRNKLLKTTKINSVSEKVCEGTGNLIITCHYEIRIKNTSHPIRDSRKTEIIRNALGIRCILEFAYGFIVVYSIIKQVKADFN